MLDDLIANLAKQKVRITIEINCDDDDDPIVREAVSTTTYDASQGWEDEQAKTKKLGFRS